MTEELKPLSSFSDQPLYNIKAACKRTRLKPATLRAWERRYALLSPDRAEQGYRLYSARDLAILFWLQRQIQAGMNISQASHQFQTLLANGEDPLVNIPPEDDLPEYDHLRSPQRIAEDLVHAFIRLDYGQAERLCHEAIALYTLETALIDILRRAIHAVEEQVDDEPAPMMIRRFATNYARQLLLNMIQLTPTLPNRSTIVLAGLPGEDAEIDLLILNLLLRRQGWEVIYLGTDLTPTMISPMIVHLRVGLLLIYTDDPKNAFKLIAFAPPHDESGRAVYCAYAGRAVELDPDLRTAIVLDYFGSDLHGIMKDIGNSLTASKSRI